jgi:hypothetical protein
MISVGRINAFEPKCHAPIAGYPNRKRTFAPAFQWVQPEARNIHFM